MYLLQAYVGSIGARLLTAAFFMTAPLAAVPLFAVPLFTVSLFAVLGSWPVAVLADEHSAAGATAKLPAEAELHIEIRQPQLQQWLPADAKTELLGQGYLWSEGPVAVPDSADLLFTDVPANRIYRYSPTTGVTVLHERAGGSAVPSSNNKGANGLLFSPDGTLLLAQHGDRQIARFDLKAPSQGFSTVVSQFAGRQFNSPNDLVLTKDGTLIFTDPPYGLKGGDNSPAKQLAFNGVYQRNKAGVVQLLTDQLNRPNGVALSPDEQWLYVSNSDPKAMQIWRFQRRQDGGYQAPQLWLDFNQLGVDGPGLPDGLKVLPNGWVLATGPGGVWVLAEDASVLGRIHSKVAVANLAWHAKTGYLYLTASQFLLRLPLHPAG